MSTDHDQEQKQAPAIDLGGAGGNGLRGWSQQRRGVLPKRSVRTVAFAIISLSIFLCGALCLLAVWDYASQGVPWRAITSLGIVAGTMGAFAFVNELFGEAMAADDARGLV